MIEKHILRTLVLEQLRRTPKTQINHVIDAVEKLVTERGLQENLNPTDNLTISEIVWGPYPRTCSDTR